ncbi:MAG: ABC transporter substrate binding protein [Gammaproteobacteria bacterium]
MLLRSVSLMSSMMLVGFLTLIFSAPMYAKTIAFLVDNRHIDDRFRFTQRLESEIQAVINPQYTVNFRRYYGDAQHSIRQHVQTLYADATVDAVVVIGPLASNEVIQLRRVNIPTIVTGVIDRRVQPVPKTSSPGSGRTNIYYLNRHHDVEAEIDMLRSLTPFSHIAVLVSPSLLQAIPVLANFNIRQSNYRISVHAVTRDFEDDFAQWPDDVDAVYFAPHFEWSRAEITALASFLRAQRLPAFSYLEADLECGFLATEGNDKNDERFFRHIALNVERVVSGTAVELLPIAFDQRMQMTINMETARQLGISPSWSLLTDARRIHDLSDSIPRINIHRVALSARESSLSVKAGQAGVAAAEHDVGRAQAALYPQLTAVVSSVGIDEDRANASFGQQAEYSTRGQLTLSQNIYSETSRAARDIARHQYHQQASGQTQTELDAIYEAVGYFITVLQSQALESIREKNHQFTRQNVELAETRQRLGATGPSDLYRWQSQLAADEQDLTVARARLQQSKITLRHRLHQALTADFVAVEPPFKTVSAFDSI